MPLAEYCRRKMAYETANSPEIQPLYKHLDEAGSAEGLARDAATRWDAAANDVAREQGCLALLGVIDFIKAKTRDDSGTLKPYCDCFARLFEKDSEGHTPGDRLRLAFNRVQAEVDSVSGLLRTAVDATAAELTKAREILQEKGLPAGARDREAKKKDYEEAATALEEYRELAAAWQSMLEARSQRFGQLVAKCRERTELRVATAERLNCQLSQDLDPSVLVVEVAVHPTEDPQRAPQLALGQRWPPHPIVNSGQSRRDLGIRGDAGGNQGCSSWQWG